MIQITQVALIDAMDRAQEVGKLYLMGRDPRDIAKELDLKLPEVRTALHDWQELLRTQAEGGEITERVMDVLFEVDAHYRLIVDKAWETVEQANDRDELSNKIAALKLIESINKSRAAMFQQAGVNQDTELIAKMNETRRRQEIVFELLQEIKKRYPAAAQLIATELSKIQPGVEVIRVEQTAITGGDGEST